MVLLSFLTLVVAIHALDPKTSEILRANLHSPGTSRHIRQVNANTWEPPFIHYKQDNLKKSFEGVLKTLLDRGVKNPSYTAAIDGTLMVALLEYSKSHG
jgi:hypothetical protein